MACSPIHTLDQALAHPQVAERALIAESEHPVLGKVRNMGLPVRFRGGSRQAHRAPPLLGQHTDEILLQAGYTPESIEQFKARGVVACAEANDTHGLSTAA